MEYLLILWMVAVLAQTHAVTPQKMLYAYVFQVVCLFWNCVFFRAPQDLASLDIFPWMGAALVLVFLEPFLLFLIQVRREQDIRRTPAFHANPVSLAAALAAAVCYVVLDGTLPFTMGRDYLACAAAQALAGLLLLVRSRSVSVRLAGLFSVLNGILVFFLVFGTFSL